MGGCHSSEKTSEVADRNVDVPRSSTSSNHRPQTNRSFHRIAEEPNDSSSVHLPSSRQTVVEDEGGQSIDRVIMRVAFHSHSRVASEGDDQPGLAGGRTHAHIRDDDGYLPLFGVPMEESVHHNKQQQPEANPTHTMPSAQCSGSSHERSDKQDLLVSSQHHNHLANTSTNPLRPDEDDDDSTTSGQRVLGTSHMSVGALGTSNVFNTIDMAQFHQTMTTSAALCPSTGLFELMPCSSESGDKLPSFTVKSIPGGSLGSNNHPPPSFSPNHQQQVQSSLWVQSATGIEVANALAQAHTANR